MGIEERERRVTYVKERVKGVMEMVEEMKEEELERERERLRMERGEEGILILTDRTKFDFFFSVFFLFCYSHTFFFFFFFLLSQWFVPCYEKSKIIDISTKFTELTGERVWKLMKNV